MGGAGGQSGAQESAVCMGLGRRSLEPRDPAILGSAVHTTTPFCRGLLSPGTPPPPPLQPLGHTMALSKTLWVGVAMCRGRGRYAGHWWPLAWHTCVDLEGCRAPRSGSWPQSRGLGLLPTPVLSLCILCPSVLGEALEGLWGLMGEGCMEGLLPALVSLLPLGEVPGGANTGGIQAVPLRQLCLLLPASCRPGRAPALPSAPSRCVVRAF